MLAGKILPDYFNLSSLNDYKKNDKIICLTKQSFLRLNMSSLEFRLKEID